MIHQAYIELHNQLFTELSQSNMDTLGLPGLLWVDRENQQFVRILEDGGHDVLPVRFPAINIEFGEITWKGTTGELVITFRVAYESYADSYQNKEGGSINQLDALKDLQFLDQVHLALQNFQPSTMTPLIRNASRYANEYGPIIVHEMDYTAKVNAEVKTGTMLDIVEICAVPMFPTPPAHEPATLYKIGQKVTDNDTLYICIQTMLVAQPLTNVDYWRTIPENQLYIVI